jgi:hypothetical protein
MFEEVVIRSAEEAIEFGLSWRFIQDGEGFGIMDESGDFLPVNFDDDGEPDGWLYRYEVPERFRTREVSSHWIESRAERAFGC